MPSPSDFSKAFKLGRGEALAGSHLVLDQVHVGHVVKQASERYEFPCELALASKGAGHGAATSSGGRAQHQAAAAALRRHARPAQGSIVYSPYGSPWECRLGPARVCGTGEDGRILLRCTGTARRRRDLPTLKEVKERERREAGVVDDISPEDTERYLSDCRIIKSRFGSGRCAACGQRIDPGLKIAKKASDAGRGGWAHATCLLQQRRAADCKGRKKAGSAVGGKGGKGSKGKVAAQVAGGKRTTRRGAPRAAAGRHER